MDMDRPMTPLRNSKASFFRGYHAGDVLLLRLTTGEVAIATYQSDDGVMVQLLSPRVIRLEKMHLMFVDFMMAGDAKASCEMVIAHIVAVGRPTAEAEEGYRGLISRL